MTLFSLAGIALAAVTLPGVWLALCVALLCNLWQPGMFNWWTLGICAGAGALGEIIELAASALGAKKAGGTRAGALSALGGTLIGAFAGSFFFFPIGTVAGAVLGAGIGAMIGVDLCQQVVRFLINRTLRIEVLAFNFTFKMHDRLIVIAGT